MEDFSIFISLVYLAIGIVISMFTLGYLEKKRPSYKNKNILIKYLFIIPMSWGFRYRFHKKCKKIKPDDDNK